ncbi:MAG: hypothetical protein DCC43_07730 [Candidatus Brocadia sp.]|nr:hypothetical protein [Candidatus Brocadia sp. AMX3]RIJ99847.1 MAG: hypothetical protein DCC43_07730 [Candidatus Brocadia sp.]
MVNIVFIGIFQKSKLLRKFICHTQKILRPFKNSLLPSIIHIVMQRRCNLQRDGVSFILTENAKSVKVNVR